MQAGEVAEQLLGVFEIERRRRRGPARQRRFEKLQQRQLLAADLTFPSVAESELEFYGAAEITRNEAEPADVNADSSVSAMDGLLLINAINHVLTESERHSSPSNHLDVTGDGHLNLDDFAAFVAVANHKSSLAGNGLAATSSDSPISDLDADNANSDGTDSGSGGAGSGDGGAGGTGGTGSNTGDDAGSQPASNGGGSAGAPDVTTPTTEPADGSPAGGSGGPTCDHRLAGTTVNENEEFALALTVDQDCASQITVDWGDGYQSTFKPDDVFTHTYLDDYPTGTPVDKFTVVATIYNESGVAETLNTVVTVKNVPPEAVDDSVTVDEDTVLFISPTVNDIDAFPDVTVLKISKVNTSGTVGEVTLSPFGAIKYDPRGKFDCLAQGETATDSFTYTIHDDDDSTKTSTATVNISIVGQRELYTVSYGAGGHAYEAGEKAAPVVFTVSPAVKCGPLNLVYHRDEYQGAASLPLASNSDITQPAGTVRIAEGARSGQVLMTPVDDRVIEEHEWFFFTVDAETTNDYEVFPVNSQAGFKIHDDEWRFVAGSKSESGQIGPLHVEAFTNAGGSSLLSGAYSLSSSYEANIGSTSESTALVRADSGALLTRPGALNNQASDYVQMGFHCNSQTGDVWRNAAKSGGTNNDSPLSTTVGMNYQVNDIGTKEALVMIDVDFEFLAGGTIGKSFSPGFSFQIGDTSKATTGGYIKLDKQITYSGGVTHSVGEGFTLHCQRGPKY